MTLQEAIDARVSRRTYDGTPLTQAESAALKALIDKANKDEGLSIKLIEDASAVFGKLSKSYGMFSGVRSVIMLAGKPATPDLYRKLGYRGEMIVLEATRLGLGTCWVSGTFNKDDPALRLADGEIIAAVVAIGHVKEQRSIKERLIRGLAHGKEKPIDEIYTADREPPEWFLAGVRAAFKAPSAINLKPVRFRQEGDEAIAFTTRDDETGNIDLGIACAHFEIASGRAPTLLKK
ncbi:MAG TPA: nitroreductase family protein [Treponemataceae bacterium]|nr:nitroreductase family protein [Treponemataceae bacterium]